MPCSRRSTASSRWARRRGSSPAISCSAIRPRTCLATLAHALLREDAGFHAFQMLEAGVRQYEEWGATDQGRHVLIAVARYLAAHAPTERSAFQTADIAKRLMRGGRLHEEADEASA